MYNKNDKYVTRGIDYFRCFNGDMKLIKTPAEGIKDKFIDNHGELNNLYFYNPNSDCRGIYMIGIESFKETVKANAIIMDLESTAPEIRLIAKTSYAMAQMCRLKRLNSTKNLYDKTFKESVDFILNWNSNYMNPDFILNLIKENRTIVKLSEKPWLFM